MKSDSDNDEKENDSELNTDGECLAAPSYLNNERGEDYQEQIGMPDEENMRSWSHHHSTDTVDDPIFRAAMRGYDQVSFVFGLEVTWSLIQQRQQDEEERQAMLELESMKEMNEAFDIVAVKEEEVNDDDTDENDDDVMATKKSSAAKKLKTAPTEKKAKACTDKKSKARVLDSDEDSDEDDDDDDGEDMKDFIVKEEDEDDGDDDMEHEDVAKEEVDDSSADEDGENSEGDMNGEDSPCVEDITDVMMAKKNELTQKMIDDAEEINDDEIENKEEESESLEITEQAASVAVNAPIDAAPAETNEATQSGAWTCEVSQSVRSVFAFDDKAYLLTTIFFAPLTSSSVHSQTQRRPEYVLCVKQRNPRIRNNKPGLQQVGSVVDQSY